MERRFKKNKANEDAEVVFEVLRSRKSEARGLLRRCFKNTMFSFVPFEIWREILCEGEKDVIARISQTCWGFKELVDNLRELLLEYALKYRREDKIENAKNLIMRCADIGNSKAMFHIAHAMRHSGGWGLKQNEPKAQEWFKKSAMCGNALGMAYYANCLLQGRGVKNDGRLGAIWSRKALSSKDSLALGFCHYYGLRTVRELSKAVDKFGVSAKEGNEFGQRWLAICLEWGKGVNRDYEKAYYWYLKSAEQGLAASQFMLGQMLGEGKGCEKNEELSKIWKRKANNQGYI